jgi:hypothetical protein
MTSKINNMYNIYPILLYGFLQVLYSIKENYTKVEYFPRHILFITIYLLLD